MVNSLPQEESLNDFGMAAVLNPDGSIDPTSTSHHHLTGTLPFMALDALQPPLSKTPPDPSNVHHYHYDLESLFYISIWAATLYDLEGGHRIAPKENFLFSGGVWGVKFPSVTPNYLFIRAT
ncbi:hypothetical protein JR316_0003874 [Psilocybe cubensis]|uniref:Uncharacterized protein n=1 Tax=Psilocybe cubensis TaxID=181762 RepID=A0ACB8H9B1_PSICU|nr:hypothetical protein JR316_0003874 [Psilocybe cubensis]KAH9484393.1 hypothetical protein JR316_0003874 [Psilocybe cubensis]